MFKEMRRKEKSMGDKAILDILARGSYGVLGSLDEMAYPNVTPLNYAYQDGYIYFHGAKVGKKLDNIRFSEKVSFLVVDYERVVPEKFDTHYDSVVVFGRAEELLGEDKKLGLGLLAEKYSGDFLGQAEEYIKNALENTSVIRIRIEHMTGKIGR